MAPATCRPHRGTLQTLFHKLCSQQTHIRPITYLWYYTLENYSAGLCYVIFRTGKIFNLNISESGGGGGVVRWVENSQSTPGVLWAALYVNDQVHNLSFPNNYYLPSRLVIYVTRNISYTTKCLLCCESVPYCLHSVQRKYMFNLSTYNPWMDYLRHGVFLYNVLLYNLYSCITCTLSS